MKKNNHHKNKVTLLSQPNVATKHFNGHFPAERELTGSSSAVFLHKAMFLLQCGNADRQTDGHTHKFTDATDDRPHIGCHQCG